MPRAVDCWNVKSSPRLVVAALLLERYTRGARYRLRGSASTSVTRRGLRLERYPKATAINTLALEATLLPQRIDFTKYIVSVRARHCGAHAGTGRSREAVAANVCRAIDALS
jgi:hypothetical protein